MEVKKMKLMETIEKRLLELINERKIDNTQFCKEINLNTAHFDRIIRGQNPYLMTNELNNIAKGFGMKLAELFDSDLFDYKNLD